MQRQKEPPPYTMLAPLNQLHHKLLHWFDLAQRPMPWRQTRDPYAIWLSETMLQQTQVETVTPYWHRFLQKFPTINDLAQADLQDVLALWAGLGYYRRARHLHQAAKHMVQHHNGSVPNTVEQLLTLPGVGRYTAGAVASIAFEAPAPVVDGNVMRVLARLTAYDKDIADPKNTPFFWNLAQQLLDSAQPQKQPKNPENTKVARAHTPPRTRNGDLNQSLMELGALICTPTRPACLMCPVQAHCRAFAQGRQETLPVKRKKAPTPTLHATALVVRRRDLVLLLQRPPGGLWADMWEFPVLPPSTNPETLGLKLRALTNCGQVRHQLTHRTFQYQVIACEAAAKSPPRLPDCLAGNAPYTAARWAPWPLPARSDFPVARVVHKIAAAVKPPATAAPPTSLPPE